SCGILFLGDRLRVKTLGSKLRVRQAIISSRAGIGGWRRWGYEADEAGDYFIGGSGLGGGDAMNRVCTGGMNRALADGDAGGGGCGG
ncbi:MAG: hypothetical protein KDC12_09200, partial [Flavobacteriales bacterium]|nr:hypothetical protein [Flavobacteriales bacterium]